MVHSYDFSSCYASFFWEGEWSVTARGLEIGAPTIPGLTPNYIFNGVAVNSSCTIYVTGDKTNVLFSIEAGS